MINNSEEWMDDALCRQGDPEMWHPEGSGRGADTASAKSWCRLCPVQPQCRLYIMRVEDGLPLDTRYGVWAGMTPRERWNAAQHGGVVSA